MSNAKKARKKVLTPGSELNVSFEELITVLSGDGFFRDGGKGSHQVWRHPDGRKIILPRHGNEIKPIYIKTARALLQDAP